MQWSSSFSVSLQFSLHSPAQRKYISCVQPQGAKPYIFSRENNTVCHGNEWNVGPGRIDAEAVFLWKHNSKGEAFTKAAYDSLPPAWWNKSKKESLLSLICAVGDPSLLFQGVFGEFSHILHGSADASFSAILHSVTPDQPEPLSLSYFFKTLWWIHVVHALALCDKYIHTTLWAVKKLSDEKWRIHH